MFHWNVEGQNFSEYHGFWSDVYEDLFDQNDILAEFIRQAGEFAPGSLTVYTQTSDVSDEEGFPSAIDMFRKFQIDNQKMIALYDHLYHVAESNHEHQISNYAADRLAAHKKHAWMVRSFLK